MQSQSLPLELTQSDIPGAYLEEPLDKHGNEALRWWLLCRGISVAASTRKPQLIARFVERVRGKGLLILQRASALQ